MKKIILLLLCLIPMASFAKSQALNQLIYEIRNPETDAPRFRHALESIGEYLALDVLDELSTTEVIIKTLTGSEAKHALLKENPVLITILRGGLPLNIGVQKVFPQAETGFLAMSRDKETLKARVDYVALPDLKDRCVILSDTMLATGGSMIDAIKIIEKAHPKKIFVITAIASEPGRERVINHNRHIKIFAGVVDPSLNEKGYIIPGLGDAGDRSFGKKQQGVHR